MLDELRPNPIPNSNSKVWDDKSTFVKPWANPMHNPNTRIPLLNQ